MIERPDATELMREWMFAVASFLRRLRSDDRIYRSYDLPAQLGPRTQQGQPPPIQPPPSGSGGPTIGHPGGGGAGGHPTGGNPTTGHTGSGGGGGGGIIPTGSGGPGGDEIPPDGSTPIPDLEKHHDSPPSAPGSNPPAVGTVHVVAGGGGTIPTGGTAPVVGTTVGSTSGGISGLGGWIAAGLGLVSVDEALTATGGSGASADAANAIGAAVALVLAGAGGDDTTGGGAGVQISKGQPITSAGFTDEFSNALVDRFWSPQSGTWTESSGQLHQGDAGGGAICFTPTTITDGAATVTLTATIDGTRLWLRCDATMQNGYMTEISADGMGGHVLQLYAVVGGAVGANLLGLPVAVGLSVGDTFTLEGAGTTLNVYVGGVAVATTADPTYSSGLAGLSSTGAADFGPFTVATA